MTNMVRIPDNKLDLLEEIIKTIDNVHFNDSRIYHEIQEAIDSQLHKNIDLLLIRCKALFNNGYYCDTVIYHKLSQIL